MDKSKVSKIVSTVIINGILAIIGGGMLVTGFSFIESAADNIYNDIFDNEKEVENV